jgi:1-deoxy-D-xylulose-5-phosphate reductoisomerase
MGEGGNETEKIVLTASGGPFRGWDKKRLQQVTPEMALKHPVWKMGEKVSIDSATLMNKGLEVIEAYWLFGLKPPALEVIIHPESVIHSLVYFSDGSVKTQMSAADMRIPIQFAFSYPDRLKNEAERPDFARLGSLNFEQPDLKNFRNLALAFQALEKGGNMPCILNASNEIAVQAFLKGHAGFLQIPEIIDYCMQKVPFIENPAMEDYFDTDKHARLAAKEFLDLHV